MTCPVFHDSLAEAERAVLEARMGDARASLDQARESLGCGLWADRAGLVRLWLTEGAYHALQKDGRELDYFRAAATLDPQAWNPDLGTTLEGVWKSATPASTRGTLVLEPDLPAKARLWIDGVEGSAPVELTTGLHAVQLGHDVPEQGAVVEVPAGGEVSLQVAVHEAEARGVPWWLVGAGALSAGAGGLAALALAQDDPMAQADSKAELDQAHGLQQAYAGGAYGAAALALGCVGVQVALAF